METLINPNQIRDGGSKEIKILNVVQTGTLYRSGTKFGNFSNNNYLTIGSRADNGILSIDSSSLSYKNMLEFSQADDWEFVIKFKTPDNFVKQGITYYGWMLWEQAGGSNLYIDRTNKLIFNNNGIHVDSENSLVENTVYYIKLKYLYSESTYKLYLSTTGEFNGEETLEITVNDQIKIPNKTITFGKYASDDNYSYTTTVGYIDMEGTYIKISGEYWWKGVEIL